MMVLLRSVFIMGVCAIVRSQDYLGRSDKDKLIWMAAELVRDAKNKIHQTDGIREQHAYFAAFEVGYIMGTIREKYKMMMEIYRIVWYRHTKKQQLNVPKIPWYRPVHYFVMYEYIVMTELELDKMVEILEKMPDDRRSPFIIRAGADESSNEEDRKRFELEEKVKSQYRQQYLMKKLNSSEQSTTKKRFVNSWPVRDTWSLEKY